MVDKKGNMILDLNAAASGQIIGYNNEHLTNARDSELYDRFVTHKADANSLPPHDFADIVRQNVMKVAPEGMLQVHLGGGRSATEANELAMHSALNWFSKEHNADRDSLSVLGFSNSHHGNSTATLSASSPDSNPHSLPTYGWPIADFPQLKYPLCENEKWNFQEEDRCVEQVKNLIAEKNGTVGAIIIEPISSFGN